MKGATWYEVERWFWEQTALRIVSHSVCKCRKQQHMILDENKKHWFIKTDPIRFVDVKDH